ncbi:hypothetical protein N7508_010306 [Penicillium antarcticum]|uniref:uncharacterized protein n=1 Tax=Penicillium antarcticum TaxID=416450 RepID=UPI0023A0659B|nr:uncharacterized protein N7508_010306 [Penicillium antarcticum]KAJ5295485.1 hypothetical protein N7508_010306 [Penicillium antarcticum]
MPDGMVPFEGYFPFQCDGEPALDDPRSPLVKIIETVGEYELYCHQTLYGSDAYRLYEVPGLSARNAKYDSMAGMADMTPGTYDLACGAASTAP